MNSAAGSSPWLPTSTCTCTPSDSQAISEITASPRANSVPTAGPDPNDHNGHFNELQPRVVLVLVDVLVLVLVLVLDDVLAPSPISSSEPRVPPPAAPRAPRRSRAAARRRHRRRNPPAVRSAPPASRAPTRSARSGRSRPRA